jgi:hypothetical protein
MTLECDLFYLTLCAHHLKKLVYKIKLGDLNYELSIILILATLETDS